MSRAHPIFACLLLAALAACGGAPAIDPSTRATSDPIVLSAASIFRNACIRTAPEFAQTPVQAAVAMQQPVLVPGMRFAAAGRPGKTCEITVHGYGRDRPGPTFGDVTSLARSLQTRLGGELTADPEAGTAQLKVGRKRYDISAQVARNGDLTFEVRR